MAHKDLTPILSHLKGALITGGEWMARALGWPPPVVVVVDHAVQLGTATLAVREVQHGQITGNGLGLPD